VWWDGDARLNAFNAITGERVWQYEGETLKAQNEAGYVFDANPPLYVDSSPRYARPFAIPGAILFVGYDCALVAVNPSNGKLVCHSLLLLSLSFLPFFNDGNVVANVG
jgi:outer membrane protein assembly factor BamB